MADARTPTSAAGSLSKRAPGLRSEPKRPLTSGGGSNSQLDRLVAEEQSTRAAVGSKIVGFSEFPDFSGLNEQTHDTSRKNTFNTPSSLHKRFETPLRTDKRYGLGDTKDLMEICEAGFAKSMRLLGKEILRDSKEELANAIRDIKSELVKGRAVEESSEAKFIELHGLVSQIHQVTTTQPVKLDFANADLAPLAAYLDAGYEKRGEAQRSMLQELETQVIANIAKLQGDVNDLMQRHDTTEKVLIPQIREEVIRVNQEIGEVCQRSEAQLNKLVQMQESLVEDVAKRNEVERYVETVGDRCSGNLESILQTRLMQHFEIHSVKVDFAQMVSRVAMTEKSVIGEIDCLGQEIAKIQQALHIDFAQVIDGITSMGKKPDGGAKEVEETKREAIEDAPSAVVAVPPNGAKKAVRERKRIREFWSQTDIKTSVDQWTMTDKSLMKKPAKGSQRVLQKAVTEAKLGAPGKKIFADAEAMRKKAREAAIKPQYNVFDYYHKDGRIAFVAKTRAFEFVTQVVIFLNSIWIWVDTDYNDSDTLLKADPVFVVAENLFCTYFTFEILIRFLAFEKKINCLFDGWFVFDSCLVMLMILETWIYTVALFFLDEGASAGAAENTSIFRIARLVKMLRISRLTRLLRAVPELMILVKGIGAASRSVVVFMVLWLIIVYVFAILFRQITDATDIGGKHFKTVPYAMNTLLLEGILPDNAPLLSEINENYPWVWPVFMIFILLACVTLMYMLIGVLVEVVSSIASSEKESMAVGAVATRLRDLVFAADDDMNQTFTKQQFIALLARKDIASALSEEHVDVVALMDSADIIFQELEKGDQGGEGMDFTSLCEVVLNMRGQNPATVKDMKLQLRVTKALIVDAVKELNQTIGDQFEDVKTHLLELKEAQEREVSDNEDDDEGPFSIAQGLLQVR